MIVSDLTYVNVKLNGITYESLSIFLIEITGSSTGLHKDANLVVRAFASIQDDLRDIQLFHTDRGSEFKNQLTDETLVAFNIRRSLSRLSK